MSLGLTLAVLISVTADAENQFLPLFQQGVLSFQQKNHQAAAEQFGAALNERPDSFVVLYNLALVQMELKNHSMALGLLRRALELRPGHAAASLAMARLQKLYPVTELPRDLPFWEQYRNLFLEHVSLGWYLFLLAVSLAASLFFGIRRLQTESKNSELISEGLGFSIPVILFALFTGMFCILSVSKYIDQSIQRGTLTTEKVPLRSAPDTASPVLIELSAGLYVEVMSQQNEWLQVQYPGSFSGWIQQKDLFYPGKKFQTSQKE